jgi:ParB-like chromosome segregation protein Spo0J
VTAEPTAAETTLVEIGSVSPHPRNPRQGDVGVIAESLTAYGQFKPIVVQASTRHVLAGNHTYLAARALGWPTIWAYVLDVDDETAARIMVADNRTSDRATYDTAALADLLADLAAATENGLAATGWDSDDLDRLLAEIAGPDAPLAFPDAEALAGETEHACPRCGYRWSGAAAPGE